MSFCTLSTPRNQALKYYSMKATAHNYTSRTKGPEAETPQLMGQQQGVKVGSESHGEPSVMGPDERKGTGLTRHPGAWQTSSKDRLHHLVTTARRPEQSAHSQMRLLCKGRKRRTHSSSIYSCGEKRGMSRPCLCTWPGPHQGPISPQTPQPQSWHTSALTLLLSGIT